MTLDIFKEKGTPLDKQRFTWRELMQAVNREEACQSLYR
jgi:hypothetical protein